MQYKSAFVCGIPSTTTLLPSFYIVFLLIGGDFQNVNNIDQQKNNTFSVKLLENKLSMMYTKPEFSCLRFANAILFFFCFFWGGCTKMHVTAIFQFLLLG